MVLAWSTSSGEVSFLESYTNKDGTVKRMIKALINLVKTNPFSNRKFVGKDLNGNMYYEEASQRRGRRTIEYFDGRNHVSQYETNDIPVEWQSWLRHTRVDFPSLEELKGNQHEKEAMKERIKELL